MIFDLFDRRPDNIGLVVTVVVVVVCVVAVNDGFFSPDSLSNMKSSTRLSLVVEVLPG